MVVDLSLSVILMATLHPSSGPQFSISSSHYDPELATVQVTVPELAYHLQVTFLPPKAVSTTWQSSTNL